MSVKSFEKENMSAVETAQEMGDLLEFSPWARTQYLDKYAKRDRDGNVVEEWPDTARRVVTTVLGVLGYGIETQECRDLIRLVTERKFIPGGRYLANTGMPFHQVNNCFLYRCEDSREGWADLSRKAILALSTGGGIGVVYSDVRPSGTPLWRVKGVASGPLSPMKIVNETAREVMAGSRRSAIWAGLHWWHPDIFEFIKAKDWSDEIKAMKEKDFNFPAPLDMTNISVILDDDFFAAYHDESHDKHAHAVEVYWSTVEHMVRTGEPGFSVNVGENAGEDLRNACTEITSRDDSDVCNLGSLNMARIEGVEEFRLATRLGTLFLLAGTVYSDVPHVEVYETRYKNRRLGLGLMGVHEWLIKNGERYEITDSIRPWLEIYRDESRAAADHYARTHALSIPLKVRAIAPNGTIGIIAETTTSGEPVLFVACKRRFLENGVWRYQYVIDPTVERMRLQYGINPDEIETAYILAYDVEQRIKFQADLQEYVDHGISSTINLPYPITDPEEVAEFGDTLLGYLPRLRGITCYPEGARAGQPFTPVRYSLAADQLGVTFDENRDQQCASGVCGV